MPSSTSLSDSLNSFINNLLMPSIKASQNWQKELSAPPKTHDDWLVRGDAALLRIDASKRAVNDMVTSSHLAKAVGPVHDLLVRYSVDDLRKRLHDAVPNKRQAAANAVCLLDEKTRKELQTARIALSPPKRERFDMALTIPSPRAAHLDAMQELYEGSTESWVAAHLLAGVPQFNSVTKPLIKALRERASIEEKVRLAGGHSGLPRRVKAQLNAANENLASAHAAFMAHPAIHEAQLCYFRTRDEELTVSIASVFDTMQVPDKQRLPLMLDTAYLVKDVFDETKRAAPPPVPSLSFIHEKPFTLPADMRSALESFLAEHGPALKAGNGAGLQHFDAVKAVLKKVVSFEQDSCEDDMLWAHVVSISSHLPHLRLLAQKSDTATKDALAWLAKAKIVKGPVADASRVEPASEEARTTAESSAPVADIKQALSTFGGRPATSRPETEGDDGTWEVVVRPRKANDPGSSLRTVPLDGARERLLSQLPPSVLREKIEGIFCEGTWPTRILSCEAHFKKHAAPGQPVESYLEIGGSRLDKLYPKAIAALERYKKTGRWEGGGIALGRRLSKPLERTFKVDDDDTYMVFTEDKRIVSFRDRATVGRDVVLS